MPRQTEALEEIPEAAWSWWTAGSPPLTGTLIGADTETAAIQKTEDGSPAPVPPLAIATFTDGITGYFVHPDDLARFMETLPTGSILVFHNIEFDALVMEQALASQGKSFWPLVDQNRVCCTLEMERLLSLATVGNAHAHASLDALAQKYCGQPIEKSATDSEGDPIRTSFGKYIGQPRESFLPEALAYAGGDTTSVMAVWRAQQRVVAEIKGAARGAYGWPGDEFLNQAWAKYGPLTIHVQVKAAIVCALMHRQGVMFDTTRRDAVMRTLAGMKATASSALRRAGIFVPWDEETEAGTMLPWEAAELPKKGPAVRTSVKKHMLAREAALLESGILTEPFERTDGGDLKMTKDTIADMQAAVHDPILDAYSAYAQAIKWKATYAEKMSDTRAHPTWNHLLATGRCSCSGSMALQTLPKCTSIPKDQITLRQCIVMGEGLVTLAVDFSQIELVGLAAAMKFQTRYGQGLADVIESGRDVHAAIAQQMFGDRIGPVSPAERKMVKPISFGLPGAMGAATLRSVAQHSYGLDLDEHRVVEIMNAYKLLAPELGQHLQTAINAGQRVAQLLQLPTPNDGWKVLNALAGNARDFRGDLLPDHQAAPFWAMAQQLKPYVTGKSAKAKAQFCADIDNCQPSLELARSVKAGVSVELSMTLTGRVRARCRFSAARNNLFQGPTADGGILSLWRLFRAGYRIALFVHDEIVVAIPDNAHANHHKDVVSQIMRDTMSDVLCGLPVNTEGFVSRSFSQRDSFDPVAAHQKAAGISSTAKPFRVAAPKPRKGGVPKGTIRPTKPDVDFDPDSLPF